jgi:hypothetical protein
MSVAEIKKACDALPPADRIYLTELLTAELMQQRPGLAQELAQAHADMDRGQKLRHADLLRLHEELAARGL